MSNQAPKKRYSATDWKAADALSLLENPATGPTIQDGKIIKPVTVDARQQRASNVHTLTDAREKRVANSLTAATDKTNKVSPARPSYADRAAAELPNDNESLPYKLSYEHIRDGKDKQKRDPFKDLAQKVEESSTRPPHLRVPSKPPSPGFQAERQAHLAATAAQRAADSQKADLINQAGQRFKFDNPTILENIEEVPEPVEPMNPGPISKSAGKDSEFPCSYKDCSRGFMKLKELKQHKQKEHEYCEKCDMDFEDDQAFINHRKEVTKAADEQNEEGKHCACLVCGQDFNCAGGRRGHVRQAHPEAQDLRCVGCSMPFTRGAALMAHVYNNRCKDRSGLISMTNFRTGRTHASLHLEELETAGSDAETDTQHTPTAPPTAEDVHANKAGPSLRDDGANGSVTAGRKSKHEKSLNWILQNQAYHSRVAKEEDASTTADPTDDESMDDNVTVTSSLPRPVSEVLNALTIEPATQNSKVGESSKTPLTWTQNCFPGAKKTPNTTGWMQPKRQPPVIPRRIPDTAAEVMKLYDQAVKNGKKVECDWDVFRFDMDAMGRFKCPFARCKFSYGNISSVKSHLISGVHDASHDRCVKCLKPFKGAIGLIAHMESPSTKCNIRDTEQYSQLMYAISGGFLDLNDDERGTTLPDGAPRMRVATREELIAQKEANEEAERQREYARLERLNKEW